MIMLVCFRPSYQKAPNVMSLANENWPTYEPYITILAPGFQFQQVLHYEVAFIV